MPDPDPVTVTSDEELRDLADELSTSDDEVIFAELCRLRDRTREATLWEFCMAGTYCLTVAHYENMLAKFAGELRRAALAKEPTDVSR